MMNDDRNYLNQLAIKDSKVRVKEGNDYPRLNDTGDVVKDFYDFTLKYYIKKKMQIDDKLELDNILKRFSNLFLPFMHVKRGDFSLKDEGETIFEQIFRLLTNADSNLSIDVASCAGYGKTEFLSVLYQYLFKKYEEKLFDKLPLFISFHFYNKLIYKLDTHYDTQATDLMSDHCSRILDFLDDHPSQKVVLILDGADEFNYPKVHVGEFLNLIEDKEYNIDIIGFRNYNDKYDNKYRKAIKFSRAPSIKLELNQINTADTQALRIAVENFSILEKLLGNINNRNTAEQLQDYIYSQIRSLQLRSIDFFHLFLLSKGFQHKNKYSKARKSIGRFYGQYLRDCGIDINFAAKLAFNVFNSPKSITDSEKNTNEWWKIQKHGALCDYLTAFFIVESLKSYEDVTDKSVFNIVYPLQINSYSKDIVNSGLDSNRIVFDSIKKLYDQVEISARAHFCYLIGRFKDSDTKKEAIQFLLTQREKLDSEINKIFRKTNVKLDQSEVQVLLLYRTICISLIILGHMKTSTYYIKLLIDNRCFDIINRGFYLEYYGDLDFSPNKPYSLRHEDKLGVCNNTFDRLYEMTHNAVKDRRMYRLFEVDVYTICSLSQHRLAVGKLDDEKRGKIMCLINDIFEKRINITLSSVLNTYLLLIKDALSGDKEFNVASHICSLYRLKEIYRGGWIKRGLIYPETVASHVFGALLLAFFYLPEEMEDVQSYNKSEVLRMLLIHDLGEAFVGDIPTNEKSKKDRVTEYRTMRKIDMLKTYNDFSDDMRIKELYNDFAKKKSINAQIASDFDRLDNLFQLYIYNRAEDRVINDFEAFKFDLELQIQTEIGRRIAKQLSAMYLNA